MVLGKKTQSAGCQPTSYRGVPWSSVSRLKEPSQQLIQRPRLLMRIERTCSVMGRPRRDINCCYTSTKCQVLDNASNACCELRQQRTRRTPATPAAKAPLCRSPTASDCFRYLQDQWPGHRLIAARTTPLQLSARLRGRSASLVRAPDKTKRVKTSRKKPGLHSSGRIERFLLQLSLISEAAAFPGHGTASPCQGTKNDTKEQTQALKNIAHNIV